MRRLVFVVGAGASAEFNLPVGKELKHRIASLATFGFDDFGGLKSGDGRLFHGLQAVGRSAGVENIASDLESISYGVTLAESIDNYLHAHSENPGRVALGKALILQSLLEAERDSKLFFDPKNYFSRFSFTELSDTWLSVLFQILSRAGSIKEFRERLSQITFVSFNYDRVIERFFFLASQVYFDLDASSAGELCRHSLRVIHPYDSLGQLAEANQRSGYGDKANPESLLEKSKRIRTFTEAADGAVKDEIADALHECDSLFFLGFGFHRINLDLLDPGRQSRFRYLIGTTRGVSDFNFFVALNRVDSWAEKPSGHSKQPVPAALLFDRLVGDQRRAAREATAQPDSAGAATASARISRIRPLSRLPDPSCPGKTARAAGGLSKPPPARASRVRTARARSLPRRSRRRR
jgi:hypothetical protein